MQKQSAPISRPLRQVRQYGKALTTMRPWIRSGDCLVALLVFLPLAIVWPRVAMTGDRSFAWLHIAQRVTGILAFSTFLTSAMLSIRIPRIDRFFGGLTRLWSLHHGLGLACFILVMSHVLLVGLTALPTSLTGALPAMFPPLSDAPVWMGWLAFLFLFTFLAPSFKFFGQPHYQNWKRLHLLSALALTLSLAHVLPLTPDNLLWCVLAALAIFAMLWRKVLSRYVTCRPYLVTDAKILATGVVEISLRPEGRPWQYSAGQFFYVTPYDLELTAGYGEEHPYTASSAPAEQDLRIGIKALGDATQAIQGIKHGSRVLVEGPYGHFFERLYPERNQMWLGGGIGIAPFVSAARALHLAGQMPKGSVHLIYLADSLERAYYLNELRTATEGLADFRLTPHYYQSEGPITLDFLHEHCPDFAEREIYMCGPPPMAAHLKKLLQNRGVPRARIHTEDFNLL